MRSREELFLLLGIPSSFFLLVLFFLLALLTSPLLLLLPKAWRDLAAWLVALMADDAHPV